MSQDNKQAVKKRLVILGLALLVLLVVFLFYQWRFSPQGRSRYFEKAASDYYAQEEYQEAATLYLESLSFDEHNSKARLGLAKSYYQLYRYDDAQKELSTWQEQEEPTAESQYLAFRLALAQENYALAESLLVFLTDFTVTETDYAQLLQGLIAQEYHMQALEVAEEALDLYPDSQQLKQLTFQIYSQVGQYEQAIALYEEANLELSVPELLVLAEQYVQNKEKEKAARIWEELLQADFQQTEVLEQLYNYYIEEALVSEAWNLRAKILETGQKLPPSSLNLFGNSASNVREDGFLAEQGEELFYANPRKDKIIKAPVTNPQQQEEILSGRIKGLNVRGEYLYFVNQSEDQELAKMKRDGSGYEVLVKSKIDQPLVVGKTLYFLNLDEGKKLYSLDLEDQEAQPNLVVEQAVHHYCLDDQCLYFIADEDRGIYRQALGTNTAELILGGRFTDLVIDEFSNLYFLNLANSGGAVEMLSASGEHKVLSAESATCLHYYDQALYYVNWTVQRYDLRTQQKVNLASNLSFDIAVSPTWVFSVDQDLTSSVYPPYYYFHHDGSDWTLLK